MKTLSVFFGISFLFGFLTAVDFGSSSESCEDGGGPGCGGRRRNDGGGRPGGGRPGGGRPGWGNGGGNGNGGGAGSNRGCPSGWTRFNRGSYGWCVRVYRGVLSQSQSEARCKSQGAVLSGIQNQAEAQAIGRLTTAQISQPSGSVRIGLIRTVRCSTSPISSTCNSMNSFWWTDRTTTGTDGLLWNMNQPDNKDVSQKCVVLLASNTAKVTDKWTWEANRLDDVGCEIPPGVGTIYPRSMVGYVCGKKATA